METNSQEKTLKTDSYEKILKPTNYNTLKTESRILHNVHFFSEDDLHEKIFRKPTNNIFDNNNLINSNS